MTLISAQITLQLNRLLLPSSLRDRALNEPQRIIQNAKPVLMYSPNPKGSLVNRSTLTSSIPVSTVKLISKPT